MKIRRGDEKKKHNRKLWFLLERERSETYAAQLPLVYIIIIVLR